MAEVEKDKLKEQFPSNDYTQIKPREEIGKQMDPAKANKPKPDKTKMKKGVVEKKPTFGERIANNFMNIDYEGIKNRFLFDVLFPEIISALGDVLRAIFSQDGRGSTRKKGGGYTAYSSISDGSNRNRERDITRQNFRKIKLEFYERDDAKDVLDDLRERLATSASGCVSVRDLYSLADLPTNSTMLNWIWYDLEDCSIEPYGDHYALYMPPAEARRR